MQKLEHRIIVESIFWVRVVIGGVMSALSGEKEDS